MAQRTVLVTGATGKQGGALVDQLIADKSPLNILALTRNVESASAKKLAAKSSNITLIRGDFDDCDAIFSKLPATHPKVWGVYSIQVAIGGKSTPASEERQGKALIDAAIKHGVEMFVYSSVERGGDQVSDTTATAVPHFASKFRIEQYLRAQAEKSGMKWTIFRPVAFYDNITDDFMGKGFGSMWRTGMDKNKPLQFIAVRDIGIMAAKAFEEPEKYAGRAIGLAGDELNFSQAKEIFEKNSGGAPLPDTLSVVGYGLRFIMADLGKMFKFFDNPGYGVKIAEVRKMHPGLRDFATWVREESAWKGKA